MQLFQNAMQKTSCNTLVPIFVTEGYFFYGDNFYEDKSNENLVLEFFSTTLFSARISEKKTAFFLQAFSSKFYLSIALKQPFRLVFLSSKNMVE